MDSKLWFIDYRTGEVSNDDTSFPPFIPGEVDRLHEVKGHPTYFASRKGEVFSEHKDHLWCLIPDITTGYARVTLDGERDYIHRIIADLFVPYRIQGADCVLHIDGNLLNNDFRNLCWVTNFETQYFGRWTKDARKLYLPGDLQWIREHNYVIP